jgi:hypothetical protein
MKLKDIIGGFIFIIGLITAAFLLMGFALTIWNKIWTFLQMIDNPIVTIVAILGAIIGVSLLCALAKMSEFGFNIRKFFKDVMKKK